MAGIVLTLQNTSPDSLGTKRAERYLVSNGQPTIAVVIAGAGTGGQAASILSGYDANCVFRITTGSTTLAAGTLANITLANLLASTPNPALIPVNANAAALAEAVRPYAVGVALGTIQIRGGSLTPTTDYDFALVVPDAVVSIAQRARWLGHLEKAVGPSLRTVSISGQVATLGFIPDFGSGYVELTGKQ